MLDRVLDELEFDVRFYGTDISRYQKISIVLSIIVALWLGFFMFNRLDRIPATDEELASLNNIVDAVPENPELLTSKDATIIIKDGIIEYTIENDECKVFAKYSMDYKLLEKIETDYANPFVTCLIISIMVGILSGLICLLFLFFLIYLVLYIYLHFKMRSESYIDD